MICFLSDKSLDSYCIYSWLKLEHASISLREVYELIESTSCNRSVQLFSSYYVCVPLMTPLWFQIISQLILLFRQFERIFSKCGSRTFWLFHNWVQLTAIVVQSSIFFFLFVSMSDYSSVFGDTLLSKSGPVDVSTLNGKMVGVYFS